MRRSGRLLRQRNVHFDAAEILVAEDPGVVGGQFDAEGQQQARHPAIAAVMLGQVQTIIQRQPAGANPVGPAVDQEGERPAAGRRDADDVKGAVAVVATAVPGNDRRGIRPPIEAQQAVPLADQAGGGGVPRALGPTVIIKRPAAGGVEAFDVALGTEGGIIAIGSPAR